jgi:hypothetical protein
MKIKVIKVGMIWIFALFVISGYSCKSNEILPESVPLSSVTYEEIRNAMKSMTNAQFKAYVSTLEGKKIQWIGFVEDVKENYELWIDMDSPSVLLSVQDVTFKIPKALALSLRKDQKIEFEGIISSVFEVLGSCQVSLKSAKVIKY